MKRSIIVCADCLDIIKGRSLAKQHFMPEAEKRLCRMVDDKKRQLAATGYHFTGESMWFGWVQEGALHCSICRDYLSGHRFYATAENGE